MHRTFEGIVGAFLACLRAFRPERRIAKQFLSCALVQGRGVVFCHYYKSIAKCAVLYAIHVCALGRSPVTSYSGVKREFTPKKEVTGNHPKAQSCIIK